MAEIFLAKEDLSSGDSRTVVVKRLLPRADTLWKELFERERLALEDIDSPNVVSLLRSGPDFLLLEYVDGPALESLLTYFKKRGQRLPLGVAKALLGGLFSGLRDIHEAKGNDGSALGLVHRDINPSNILVGKDGKTTIIDLGVVHTLATRDQTQVGVKGTLGYMAPEQLAAKPVDCRTDLYASALVAYEVLTGNPARPPGKVGVAELIRARAALPKTPSQINPALSTEIDSVLLRALEPDPESRFECVDEFRIALFEAMDCEEDVSGLCTMASKVQTTTLGSGATMGVDLGNSVVRESNALEASLDSNRSMLFLMSLIVAIIAVALWAVLKQPADQTRLAFQGTPKPITQASAPETSPVDVESSKDVVRKPTKDAVSTAIDSGKKPEAKKFRASPRKRRIAPPKKSTEVASVKGPSIQFKVDSGETLYVSGTSVKDGFAPLTSSFLSEGAHVFRLRGPKSRQAILRLKRSGEKLSVRLGAPAGQYFSVECNGQDKGHTPVMRMVLGKRLKCRLQGASGGVWGFELEKVLQ